MEYAIRKISIILATYNEKENIGRLIDEISIHLKDYDYEIIVVDDNSSDGTYLSCKVAFEKNDVVKLILRKKMVEKYILELMIVTKQDQLLQKKDHENIKFYNTIKTLIFTFLIVMKSLFGRETYGNKKELKRLFRDDSNITPKSIRGQIVKLHERTYRTPYLSEKLEEIKRRGQKNKKQNTNEKIYWKNQNFLMHFYASYLLASTDLSSNTCKPNNKYNEQDYTVFLDYGIQETSFLKIASKMLNNQPPKKI